MADTTKIQWCDATFNPWEGCSKVSEGCANCYAEARAERWKTVKWGPQGTRRIASEAYWKKPLQWNREAMEAGVRRRIFCASLADVFEYRPELVAPRRRLFRLIAQTPWLDWLLLTKRPERVRDLVWQALDNVDLGEDAAETVHPLIAASFATLYPNVWLGVSVENQARANERLHVLRSLSARVRFVSYEPALGPVSDGGYCRGCQGQASYGGRCRCTSQQTLHWWIVGGESGNNARQFDIAWAENIVLGCKIEGVAPFVKQFGRYPYEMVEMSELPYDAVSPTRYPLALALRDAKGGDPAQWPASLRVREFPMV